MSEETKTIPSKEQYMMVSEALDATMNRMIDEIGTATDEDGHFILPVILIDCAVALLAGGIKSAADYGEMETDKKVTLLNYVTKGVISQGQDALELAPEDLMDYAIKKTGIIRP